MNTTHSYKPWLGGAVLALALLLYTPHLRAQDQYHPARELVNRVQNDLRHAADSQRDKGDARERYEHAQKQLSDFDRQLSKNNWDKGKLDAAITDVKKVVDHNTLTPPDRDALKTDLVNLRQLRATHGAVY